MYVPEELKVNKAVDVHLPSNEVYFGRFGEASVGDHLYTGDEVARMEQNKTEELEAYRRYAEAMAEEARAKSETSDE